MKAKQNYIFNIATAIGTAVPLLIAAQPGAAMAALSAAAPSLLACFKKESEDSLTALKWNLLLQAYALALSKLLAGGAVRRVPVESELKTLIDTLVSRASMIAQADTSLITVDMFYAPLKVAFLRDAARRIYDELEIFGIEMTRTECRALFERTMFEALRQVKDANASDFLRLEQSLSGPFMEASEKRAALARHHQAIIHSFSLKPIFGQEDSGVTLSDVYVRQRCLWNTKISSSESKNETIKLNDDRGFFQDEKHPEKWAYPLHVGDMHKEIKKWLGAREQTDTLRLIAGGPGSGKSTFARALAVELIDEDEFDILFVPLQEIEATGQFQQRIDTLFRDRTDLGLDRVPNPLKWLGQRNDDGTAPTRPLLLLCDGLDEIAPPDSPEANAVTTDFIQSLRHWLANRNSGGFYACALVLGRTISAQEAFRKASVDTSALLRVGGLTPIDQSAEWKYAEHMDIAHDPDEVSYLDQRIEFWHKWCSVNPDADQELPEALDDEKTAAVELRDLTAEPLLLYLLIWTGYLGERWREAAENRNNVYEEIFRQIYVRRWGASWGGARANLSSGGHVGTANLDFENYILLQEALGLAAWPSGGRTVSVDAFTPLLPTFLGDDRMEDLPPDHQEILKSVALQSYARSVGSHHDGYEFVHKSFGEYLIARAIVTWISQSIKPLRTRISDLKCSKVADDLSKIIWHGPLTSEIARFLRDEIRLRLPSATLARAELDLLVPLTNWLLANGIPVHKEQPAGANYNKIELADARATNVVWNYLQNVASVAYPFESFQNDNALSWSYGPLKMNWQTAFGFVSLVTKLTKPQLLIENGRIATFDYLDLRSQSIIDVNLDFTSLQFEVDGSFEPFSLKTSIRGANFSECNLFSCTFWGADLSFSNFADQTSIKLSFTSSTLIKANFDGAHLGGSSFVSCEMWLSNFARTELGGVKIIECRVENSDFRSSSSMHDGSLLPLYIARSTLNGSDFRGAVFDSAILQECNFTDAKFDEFDASSALFVNTDLSHLYSRSGFKAPTEDRNINISLLEREPDEKKPDQGELNVIFLDSKNVVFCRGSGRD